VIDRRGTKTVHRCHASAQAGCGLKSVKLRSSLSALTCAALQDNRVAGRNIVDRRLRRGGSGHGEIYPVRGRYRVSRGAQRNSFIKLDVAVAG
jgi:hypothetical protein